ncbi:MAG: Mrr restriction system protein [Ignavibacteriaceae bacterium]|nr:Mrr restriction system protein [Ignavibacteriaceae bacterium]
MIPDFQSIMLPLLVLLSDEREHRFKDMIEALAIKFKLTEAEKREMLASGLQEIFRNRVAWASSYLKKAGLISSPKRALFTITEEGLRVVKSNPDKINIAFLKKYASFLEFQKKNHTESEEENQITSVNNSTPEENLEAAYKSIRSALAAELLEKVLSLSPHFFEKLVIDLLVAMGYGGSLTDAGKAVGKSGDEGIDGIIKEDRLGLDIIYIQAKRWKPGTVVGRPEIQKFVGALAGQGAKKGIFITTSQFSKDAVDYNPKNETKIVLIDGEKLSQLMIDYNIGCSVERTFELKKIDNDYFEEE